MNASPHIWISAGELSGDMHAADLAQALHERYPDLALRGLAGPYMRQAGVTPLFPMENLGVMGISEVIGYLPKIFAMLRGIRADIHAAPPSALVLVDAPSFNFRLAKIAHAAGIPVYYYISPKVWASRPKRVLFMKKYVRRIFSILPFEETFFDRFGVQVEYVGNPTRDRLARLSLPPSSLVPDRIALMPGSRKREVSTLMPIFADAARSIRTARPQAAFHCIQAPTISRDLLLQFWPQDIPLRIIPGEERYSFLKTCHVLIAASGTATLESALLGVPTVVAYKVSPLTELAARLLITVPYVSLPNLILNREIFPELLQKDASGPRIAEAALRWLTRPELLEKTKNELLELDALLSGPGAALTAARHILADLHLQEN